MIYSITEDILLKIETAEAMAGQLANSAMMTNQVWPNVTVPNFEVVGKKMNDLSKSELTVVLPLIKKSKQSEWIEYSKNNQFWIEAGLEAEEVENANHPGTVPEAIWTPPNSIESTVDLIAPVWQMAPTPRNASIINADFCQLMPQVIEEVLLEEHTIISRPIDIRFLKTISGIVSTGQ